MENGDITKRNKRKFSDTKVEAAYVNYLLSCKKSQNFLTFVIAMALSAFSQIFVHLLWWTEATFHSTIGDLVGMKNHSGHNEMHTKSQESQSSFYVATVMGVCGIGVLSVLIMLQNKKVMNSPLCPPVAVCLWTVLILVPIAVRKDSVPLRIGLGWIMLEIFLIWVTLPVRFKVALLYAIGIGISHTAVVAWKGKNQQMFMRQLSANVILLVAANILGIMSFYFHDKRQRLAFEDMRQSLEVKEAMEAATKEQKRLLFSVLPRHLADTMAKDMEAAEDGGGSGFKKIYMNRHEPVSILFADIVGFTAMSAAIGSAAKLVEILNDLFTTFDTLAEYHKQVRIKILGDCYYCICGAPEDQPEHAVLCVYMGLAVVEAIKVVQKRTNSEVDMRVGIHTGAVLAGVLGQRQWQFDVYSKDVELANKMESSGTPGRVHISNTTLSFLSGQFEVEPGGGENNEERLRMAGIKTYFITKVLKPYATTEAVTNGSSKGTEDNHLDPEETYGNRLKLHLSSQHGVFSSQANRITLKFRDKQKEAEFADEIDPSSGQSYFGLACALGASTVASIFAISFNIIGFTVASILIIVIALIGSWINGGRGGKLNKPIFQNILVLICIIATSIANFTFMIPCFQSGMKVVGNSTIFGSRNAIISTWNNMNCYFPAYFGIFIPLCLCALTIMAKITSWLKIVVSCTVLGISIVVMNLGPLTKAFAFSEIYSFSNGFDIILESTHSAIYLLLILFVVCLLDRQYEISVRSLFLNKYDVVHRREQAVQLRQRNEALMCNILPTHVAEHFMDKTRDLDVLYSHNYQEVGVLFASMPNFADFYTEDAVNNQGLECLRFLNEVISDYDSILDEPKFNDKIIKIKTIGSTYMAASGLNPNTQVKPGVTMKERWRHLNLLVEFVLEMKRILDHINTESYNQFVLKIGVNYGPVTAGVIGATKPAYDIWGNTVNVASRMDSTGKAGKIQVTEDCYKILRMYGYKFEQRGYVSVKGKGQLMTYFLIGTGDRELTDEEIEELEKQDDEKAIPDPEI